MRWAALEALSSQIIGMLSYFILARLLGPEPFGLVAMAAVFTLALNLLAGMGIQQAIIQNGSIDNRDLNGAFWLGALLALVTGAIGVFVSGWIARIYDQPQIAEVFPWLVGTVVLNQLSAVQSAALQKAMLFKSLAIRGALSSLLGCSLGILMAVKGFGIWSLVGQQLAAALTGTLILWAASPWKPGLAVSWSGLKNLVGFGLQVQAFSLMTLISGQLDKFLIGYLLGPKELGWYAFAYKMLEAINNVVVNSGMKVSLPVFSKLQDNPEQLSAQYYEFVRHTAAIAFPIFLALGVSAPQLIPWVFGEHWQISSVIFQVLCVLGILQSVNFYTMSALLALGKPGSRLLLISLHALVNGLFILAVAGYGIVAVALAFTARAWLLYPLGLAMLSRYLPFTLAKLFSTLTKPLLQVSLGAGLYFVTLSYLKNYPEAMLITCLLCFVPLAQAFYRYGLRYLPSRLRLSTPG